MLEVSLLGLLFAFKDKTQPLSFFNIIADIHVAASNYSIQCLHIRKCNSFNSLECKLYKKYNKDVE